MENATTVTEQQVESAPQTDTTSVPATASEPTDTPVLSTNAMEDSAVAESSAGNVETTVESTPASAVETAINSPAASVAPVEQSSAVKMDVAGEDANELPSKEQILADVQKIVSEGDISQVSAKSILSDLVAKYGKQVKKEYKTVVKEELQRIAATLVEPEAQVDEEIEEEAVVMDDGEEQSAEEPRAPAKKKAKRELFVSKQMFDVTGLRKSNHFELTKHLWKYIKEHNLQDPNDKKVILCDDKLRAVFGKDKLTAFQMSRYFGQHLLSDATSNVEITLTEPPPPKKKNTQSKTRKKSGTSKRSGGGPADSFLSTQMIAVVGVEKSNHFGLTKLIWKYIKEHNLNKGKVITCDDKLRAVFGKDTVGSFEMARYFGQHILKDEDGPREIELVQPPPKEKKESKKRASPSSSTSKAKRSSDGAANDGQSAKKKSKPATKKLWMKPQLAEFMGVRQALRGDVQKKIRAYVTEHNLQDPKDGRRFLVDDTLYKIFKRKTLDFFKMSQEISKLLFPPGTDNPYSSEDDDEGLIEDDGSGIEELDE